jgi:hypothetical protein
MTKIFKLLSYMIVLTASFALAQTYSAPPQLPTPEMCPAGAVCKMGTGPFSTESTGPNAGDALDARPQSIWSVAQQLGFSSDQLAQLDSSLKAHKNERAALDKALQDARAALAHSLANGETFVDAEIENWASANAKVQESELKSWARLYSLSAPDQQKQLLSMPTPLSLATASIAILRGK